MLSQSLVDDLGLPTTELSGTAPGRRGGVASLQAVLLTEQGRHVVLGSSLDESPLFYTQAIPLGWFADARTGPHVVALGQCVLGKGVLTVDSAQQRALWMSTTPHSSPRHGVAVRSGRALL